MKLREDVKSKFKKIIGNGNNTFLWYDNWHPNGPSIDKYGSQIVYDSNLPKHAMVKEIIDGGTWKWPVANSTELMEVKNTIMNNPQEGEDLVVWLSNSS